MNRRLGQVLIGTSVLVLCAGLTTASAATGGTSGTRTSTLTATQAASANSGVGLPVLVENKAGQNVPVTGTVDVGNLPAVQNVNGTVNVGNLPAVQNVNGTVNVGNLPAVQNVQVVAPATQQVVLQGSADLSIPQSGLTYVKLERALGSNTPLSGQLAVSSITISQEGGNQDIEVGIRAASCDNSNGLGELEQVVVPIGQTVQLTYPSPVVLPFVPSAPQSWCLFAATVQDNGTLHVSVVGTQS
jgi:hypothetical protein